jgi:predicted nucleic acid-binding protein
MSVERISLDANILFYTVDADAGELQEKARFRNPFLVGDPFPGL